IVLDGDLGLANVAVMLGLAPRATLEHVITGRRRLAEVLMPAPGGFWVIPGGSGLEELANLSDERRRHLIGSMAQLDGRADVLLGHVPTDPYVGRGIRRQAPILLSYPSSTASLAIARLGERLTGQVSQVDVNRSSIMTFLRRMAGFTAPATLRQGVP